MATVDSVRTLLETFEAYEEKDFGRLAELYAEGVTWEGTDPGPLDCKNREDVFGMFRARMGRGGEATFHQLHGGTNTNIPLVRQHDNWSVWGPQYASIRGRPYGIPQPKNGPTYVGTLPRSMLARFVRAGGQQLEQLTIPPQPS